MTNVIDHNDYKKFLEEFHLQVGGELLNGLYTFPPSIANGTIRYVELTGNVQVLISDYVAKVDIEWLKLPCLPERYSLRMVHIQKFKTFEINIDNENFIDESENYAAIILTSSKYRLYYKTTAGTIIQNIYVSLTPQNVIDYFPEIDISKYMLELFTNKTKAYNLVPMSFNCRQSFLEAIKSNTSSPFYLLSLRTRLYEMTDYFFKQYLKKLLDKKENIDFKLNKEVELLSELDILITENFQKELPKIEELAKKVFMSTAKFKLLFKKYYGQSITEYYNNSRLNKARREIILGEKSIKEIGFLCGYKTSAQFSKAFKLCFGFPPSEIKINSN
jgi:AraC-like DNA-binding protein